ncbi:MAG: DNA repair protein RecO [Candidatus Omnitrophica bacterium]|nr:DNA repair protein RecO [Candidatus Omnitrophota bacterium]
MSIHTQDAIILHERDVRETSLLIVFYTREFGKIRGLIKGVRGPRGPLGHQVQIFTLNRVVFYDSKRSGIHTVSQCDLIDFFEAIRSDLVKVSYAYYFVELVNALTEEEDKNPEIFDLLLNSLELLKGSSSPRRITRIFEIRLLMLSGLMPRLNRCIVCDREIDFQAASFKKAKFSYKSGGLLCERCLEHDASAFHIMAGTAHFIEHVERAPYEQLARIKVSKDVGEELEGVMKKFIKYQLDKEIRSLGFIDKVHYA